MKKAGQKIQAEDYNRMQGLRSIGSKGIYKMQNGAWAKYENIDFENGKYREFIFYLAETEPYNSEKLLFELHLDSPKGVLIGIAKNPNTPVLIRKVKGIHNLFLVFHNEIIFDSFSFHPGKQALKTEPRIFLN